MARTLKDVRLAQPEPKSVARMFRELLKRHPDPDSVPDERTLARLELRPIAEVDKILAAYWLMILDTTLRKEVPEIAESAQIEGEVLIKSSKYAAWDSNPEPTVLPLAAPCAFIYSPTWQGPDRRVRART